MADQRDGRSWFQFSVTVAATHAASIEQGLIDAGALSVTLGESDSGEVFEPLPGEIALWKQVRVSGLFSDEERKADILARLEECTGATDLHWRCETLPDRVWEREWLSHSEPQCFANRLWVCTFQDHLEIDREQTVLRLDPGLAFGTGSHPTTALCLDWIATHCPANGLLIDYGCGSGILAIAGLLLGAERAIAVDIDPQALDACRANARRNRISDDRLQTLMPDQLREVEADLVVANILVDPLVRLAPTLISMLKSGGILVMSGILDWQKQRLLEAYGDFLDLTDTTSREGWLRLCFQLGLGDDQANGPR